MSQPVLSERTGPIGGGGGHIPGQAFGARGGTAAQISYSAKVDLKTGEETVYPLHTIVTITDEGAAVVGAPGGGGWGDPLDREPEKVRRDARNDIITLAKANDVYGVVLDIDTETYQVDYAATAKRRQELKQGKENN
jgi:N-methylhydantoinase B